MSIEELKTKVISEIRSARTEEEINAILNNAHNELLESNLNILIKREFWNYIYSVLNWQLREQNDISTHNLVKQALEIINQKKNL